MKKIVLVCFVLVLLGLPFALSQRLQVSYVRVESEKLSGLVRMAVVSDLHNSVFGEEQSELIRAIRDADCDALLLTGDMADSLAELDGARMLIEGLVGKTPVYYVSGNHECASGELEEIKAELRAMGVRVLEGEAEVLPVAGGVRIAGADDPLCLYRQEWRDQIAACRAMDDTFTILLSHRPDRIEYYSEGFDLTISGHAHGGQLRILGQGIWAPNQGWFPQYTSGLYPSGEGQLFVSRGLTKSLIPRLFNRPELIILELTEPKT